MTNEADYVTDRMRRWRRWTDGPLLVIAVGTLPLLLLEFVRSDLTVAERRFLDVVNVGVLVVFAVDYVVELVLASDRRLYVRREWPSLLIVVSQAIALAPALSAVGALRALRAGRALRAVATVLRLVAIRGAMRHEGRAMLRARAAPWALFAAFLTWITAAVAFTLAEGAETDGERVHSFYDALWWASATITTVGYGDVFPVTPVGRAVGMATMVVGISTFAVVTARVAAFLVQPTPGPDVHERG